MKHLQTMNGINGRSNEVCTNILFKFNLLFENLSISIYADWLFALQIRTQILFFFFLNSILISGLLW